MRFVGEKARENGTAVQAAVVGSNRNVVSVRIVPASGGVRSLPSSVWPGDVNVTSQRWVNDESTMGQRGSTTGACVGDYCKHRQSSRPHIPKRRGHEHEPSVPWVKDGWMDESFMDWIVGWVVAAVSMHAWCGCLPAITNRNDQSTHCHSTPTAHPPQRSQHPLSPHAHSTPTAHPQHTHSTPTAHPPHTQHT